jgi:hypothetical protein
MPEPIPLQSRRDEGAADMTSLAQMGEAAPQPVPAPSTQPFQEPAYDPDLPPADEPA